MRTFKSTSDNAMTLCASQMIVKKCFISQKKMVYSTQRINVLLKLIKKQYNLKIEHFSTHDF